MRIAFWAAFVVWFVVLWGLSSVSGSYLPMPSFQYADKIAHFSYFAIGSIFLLVSFWLSVPVARFRLLFLAVLALIVIGAADELHQLFTPGRSGADLGDWTADSLGAFFGAVLVWIFYAWRKI